MKHIIQNIGTLVAVFCCGIIVGLMVSAPAKVIVLPTDNRMVVERQPGPIMQYNRIIPVECCGMLAPDINTQVELEYQQLLREEDASLDQSFNSSLSHSKDSWRSVFPDQPCSR